MYIGKLIELLPDSVKMDIIDFSTVKLKTGKKAERITLERLLTKEEKESMNHKKIIGVDCVCYYRHAPEIKHSYFYVVNED